MSTTLLEQKKKQEALLPVLFGVLFITAFVLWWGYFRDSSSEPEEEVTVAENILRLSEIEIDFSIFEEPWFNNFELLEKAPSFNGEKGKENPFTSEN